jgi:hypothetical protein
MSTRALVVRLVANTRFLFATAAALSLAVVPASAALTLTGGIVYVEEGGTFDPAGNLAAFGSAFAPDIEGQGTPPPQPTGYGGAHTTTGVNDGAYGNTLAWLAGSPNSYIGLSFPAELPLASIAFGRDNGGEATMFTDRANSLYTLQYTRTAGVGLGTADTGDALTGWQTIGTLNYTGAGGQFTTPSIRHRYNFGAVSATGFRIITSVPGTGIDEFELYEAPGPNVLPPPPPVMTLTPSAGYAIGYDGNNGLHSTPDNPALVPDNPALASNGADYFASSALGEQYAFVNPFNPDIHKKNTINDGNYGNSWSWIGDDFDTNPSIGVDLNGPYELTSVAWGRDNGNIAGDTGCAGGTCTDRTLGAYTLQYTQLENADHTSPEGSDATTGWVTIATVEYLAQDPGVFDSWLRHEFTVAESDGDPILAAGIRLKVPSSGIGGGTAIDELEVYGTLVPEPSSMALVVLAGVVGLGAVWRRRRA